MFFWEEINIKQCICSRRFWWKYKHTKVTSQKKTHENSINMLWQLIRGLWFNVDPLVVVDFWLILGLLKCVETIYGCIIHTPMFWNYYPDKTKSSQYTPKYCIWGPRSSLTIFQNSSLLTLLDQLEPNLVWMFQGVSFIELV